MLKTDGTKLLDKKDEWLINYFFFLIAVNIQAVLEYVFLHVMKLRKGGLTNGIGMVHVLFLMRQRLF